MMLTLKKGSGDPIRFNPMYIHPAYLPVVKPGKEAVIIYICQPSTIADDDKLKFELNDRLNKIKLELSFKGSVYNEELRR